MKFHEDVPLPCRLVLICHHTFISSIRKISRRLKVISIHVGLDSLGSDKGPNEPTFEVYIERRGILEMDPHKVR